MKSVFEKVSSVLNRNTQADAAVFVNLTGAVAVVPTNSTKCALLLAEGSALLAGVYNILATQEMVEEDVEFCHETWNSSQQELFV